MSNIILLGLVSLFTDISSEMIYPILPLYLSTVMGAGPAIIGIIEGIAESLASIIKLFSGIAADKYGNKKRIAFAGYASSFINKIIIIFSVTWTGVLVARIIDRFGKGIRTAPRDALIAESATETGRGKAYGLHKGLDLLGTAIGILLAWLILSGFIFANGFAGGETDGADRYKTIFIISMIPAIIGLVILAFVQDKKIERVGKALAFNWKNLDTRLKLFLVFIFIFTLGNSSNAFIILRAVDAGFSPTNVILLYFLYNITGSLLSYPAGILSDKIGRKNLLCAGYFLYGVVYLGIATVPNGAVFIALFVIYGFYTAMTAGVERALIVDIVPPQHKAGALGLHAAIVGIGLLPASIIAGFLWTGLGSSAPFLFGGILAFVTSIAVFVILSRK
jgi:MFS family permease